MKTIKQVEINGNVFIQETEINDTESTSFVDNRTYEEKVESLIREKYSLNDELAILRQKDTKPQEFTEYFDYVEECKRLVKE